MTSSYYIAGDWGTSNLRLYLCHHTRGGTKVLEQRSGLGIHQLKNNFEDTFFGLCGDWLAGHEQIPVILSGMIGSNIGWKEAPYLHCPVGANEIANGRLSFSARGVSISILAGLRTQNPLGLADVMRGEELQILGWRELNPDATGQQLFALPGTHNKWVTFRDNQISNFLTAYSGELFSLLQKHSILLTEHKSTDIDVETFMLGVDAALALEQANILHALFSVRSRQLVDEVHPKHASSYLSGMIIGADVQGALGLLQSKPEVKVREASSSQTSTITIIGEPDVSQLYARVIEHLGLHCETISPLVIATAGYAAIYRALYE